MFQLSRVSSFEKVLTTPPQPTNWLVPPFVPKGGRTLIAGDFGCGKSWLLMHMALSLAAGRDWFREYTGFTAKLGVLFGRSLLFSLSEGFDTHGGSTENGTVPLASYSNKEPLTMAAAP